MEQLAELDLPFLGHRDYLQGTTLFDAIQGFIPSRAKLVYKIPQLIRTDRVRIVRGGDAGKKNAPAASLSWRSTVEAGNIGVIPLPPSPEPRRIPYDERLVAGLAEFSGQSVDLSGASPFSFVATIVSLNKHMLQRQVPPERRGRFLFVRMDLEFLPENFGRITLTVEKAMDDLKIVRTGIRVDAVELGKLYFSWLDAESLEEVR